MIKDTNTVSRADEDVRALNSIEKRRDEIIAGDLPASEEILIHCVFLRDSIAHDRRVFFEKLLLDLPDSISDEARKAVQHAVDDGSAPALNAVRESFQDTHRDDVAARCDIYLAVSAEDRDAALRLQGHRWSRHHDERFRKVLRIATVRGLMRGNWGQIGLDVAQNFGLAEMRNLGNTLVKYDRAVEQQEKHEAQDNSDEDKSARAIFDSLNRDDDDLDRLLRLDVDEDRAEIVKRPPAHTCVVVPELPEGVRGQKDIRKSFEKIAGEALPLIDRGPLDLHFEVLASKWPHARSVIETLCNDLAADERVRFRPTLLVGKPGSGKSALARAIAAQFGLPHELYNMAGASDSSNGGTSAQWSSARPSIPLQLVQRSGYANGLIVWDEIEKTDTSRHNGSAVDALLPMFERSQAKNVRDLALEVEVDLSWISHIATANDLDGVPAPIRDRMRIIKMPEPGWQDIGTLSRQVLDNIAKDLGKDSRWHEPLAPDELEVINRFWDGGSLRKLEAIIRGTLTARDQFMGRA